MNRDLTIVMISDTHGNMKELNKILQMEGDIFIHAGDFTDYGITQDFQQFFDFLDKLKFKHKIVISGNQQIMLDNGCIPEQKKKAYLARYPCKKNKEQIVSQLKKRCTYLEHEAVEIQGIKFFGSPYTQYFVGNAFQYDKAYEKVIWDAVPKNTDFLITHSPPYSILDMNSAKIHAGSKYLTQISQKIKPRVHIFGHIHEAKGVIRIGQTEYHNVAQKMHIINWK